MSEENVHWEVDRADWPAGPWDAEGDRELWRTATGMPGLMVRNRSGAWCGYVAVPPGHPWHGLHYHDIEDKYDTRVHGGLTYSDACAGTVCHIPEPGEPDDVWWAGFDCAHAWDIIPGLLALRRRHNWPVCAGEDDGDVYRDVTYVRNEVESLAAQALACTP